MQLPITEDLLSKHILLLGGIGSGKTNTFNQIIANLRREMGEDDVMIIFDSKRDFYDTFYREGDVVISNDDTAAGGYWNVFREIMIDDRVEENILEISKTLFGERLERSSQPFFPNAAKDIFAALMMELVRNENKADLRNNRALRNLFNTFSVPAMKSILNRHRDLKAMTSYIEDPLSGQTLGVVSELQQLVREIFIGNFAKRGDFSIREFVKNKGGKVAFIEYDLGLGATLTPIYKLLVDLAIKQALCRKKRNGNVYFILDEFRLLPKLNHIDNAVNFGRSLGVKILVGVQNVSQISAAYGEDTARSLLSGFSTTFAFHVNDRPSRDFVRDLYGRNLKSNSFTSAISTRGLTEELKEGSVVEDVDMTRLRVGQAIIGALGNPPFIMQFERFASESVQ